MATRIPERVSIKVVVEDVAATHAALESDPETRALAASWAALLDKADALAKSRSDCSRALSRARARLAVFDAKWDAAVGAFGRAAVDASGGRRDQPPYTRFFIKAPPSVTQGFGIAREIATARAWLVELARNADEPLAQTWTPKLKEATDVLEAAFTQRNDAVAALEPLQTSVLLLIDDVNRELDRLEGDLKKLFPGQPERVASFLSATRSSRPATHDDTEPPAQVAS